VRVGARPALRAGLAAVGISTLAMGFTDSFGAWAVLRFVAGVASAFVLVFVSAWSLERFQFATSARARSVASATLFAGVGVGIAFAGATCVQLWRAHASPDTAWIVLGLIAAAASAFLWTSFGESGGPRSASAATASRWSATRARLVLCYGAFGFGYIIPATFIAAMTRELGAAGSSAGDWAWPVFGVSAAAGTFAAAMLRGRLTDQAIWGASHVLMAAGIVAPIVAHHLLAYMVSSVLVGATLMSATMTGMQEARRVAGAQARPLIAAMTSAFAVGQIAGPLFVAAVQTPQSRYDVALGVSAVLLGATALVLFLLPNRPESP
jgi:predicted MFS family arabinose efflux permease